MVRFRKNLIALPFQLESGIKAVNGKILKQDLPCQIRITSEFITVFLPVGRICSVIPPSFRINAYVGIFESVFHTLLPHHFKIANMQSKPCSTIWPCNLTNSGIPIFCEKSDPDTYLKRFISSIYFLGW